MDVIHSELIALNYMLYEIQITGKRLQTSAGSCYFVKQTDRK